MTDDGVNACRYDGMASGGLLGGLIPTPMWGDPLSFVDPTGLDYVYQQSTGQMTHVDANGDANNVGNGYAGHGPGVNNPAMQGVKNTGPLPQGTYTIGPQQDNGKLKNSMRLTPDPTNNMFDRSRFLIHGPHANDHQDSSNGCPIFNKTIRDQIGNSGDRVLRVVP